MWWKGAPTWPLEVVLKPALTQLAVGQSSLEALHVFVANPLVAATALMSLPYFQLAVIANSGIPDVCITGISEDLLAMVTVLQMED